jgi:uncharacterized protein YbjT (DUF2867 family)
MMKTTINSNTTSAGITLVTGGTGRTGRRVAERLETLGVETRIASRSTQPAFDWNEPGSWDAALAGVTSVYISYAPDLAVPGATDTIRDFVSLAAARGVERMVLLSGRGEEEARACEQIVQNAGTQWTIVRSSWFMQNFSEGEFLDMVLGGAITLPARNIPEPFIDVNDIADVAVAALTEDGHDGEVYEVTGPRMLTFAELAQELSVAVDRKVEFVQLPQQAFAKAIVDAGVPADVAWLLNYLFDTVLDGRNASVCDGVQRALGRQPADFSEYARRIAARGTWSPARPQAAA